MPDIFIGILTYNDAPCIHWNLGNPLFWESLKTEKATVTVTVLNQGGSKGYLADIPQVNVITSPFNRNIVEGRQRLVDLHRGLMKRGDVLILLDHDTKVTRKDWLAKLLTPFADGNVGIVGSYTPADVLPTSSGAWLLQTGVTGEVDLVAACITAYRADIFLDGCEFDPIYAPLWHEDADLCLQARALGYTVHGVDGVGMFHEVGHKEHDLISERNWEFFTRKWQGKGLIKAEANQENDFLALASIAKEFLA